MNDEILPITCWGYNFAEQSLARVLAEERSKVGLWYWDEDVQANKMKRELFEEISRLYSSLDNAKGNGEGAS
jgi:hypothetical protein